MYQINFAEIDENLQKDYIKLLKNYYSGVIHDESLQKYVESEIKNNETSLQKFLKLEIQKRQNR